MQIVGRSRDTIQKKNTRIEAMQDQKQWLLWLLGDKITKCENLTRKWREWAHGTLFIMQKSVPYPGHRCGSYLAGSANSVIYDIYSC